MKNPSRDQAEPGFEQMSFLPAPEFNPIWPNPNTLPARCLSLMLAGKTFTHPEFQEITRSWRLSAVIFTLRGLGWPVESWEIPSPTLQSPGRSISRYFLAEKTIIDVFGGAK